MAIATKPPGMPTAQEQPTMTVPEAGSWLGLSKSGAYAAAASGTLPVIHIGRKLVVPTAALRRLLQLDQGA